MADIRDGQQYPSTYALVTRVDPSLQERLLEGDRSLSTRPPQNFGSTSSAHGDEPNMYELTARLNSHSPSESFDRPTSAVSRNESRKEPSVNVREGRMHTSSRKEWKSWKVHWLFNIVGLIVEIGLIIAIIRLDQVSTRHSGITTVPDLTTTLSQKSLTTSVNGRQYLSLLWTALPAFVFAVYAQAFAAIVSARYERQPFIELHRGGSVRKTIMLDYRTYPGFYNWAIALTHRHWHLGSAVLLSLLASIAIVPLSSRLFVTSAHNQPSEVSLFFTTRYDDSISIPTTNMQPFIDIATAVHAYGSIPPSWMTIEYAFAPFSVGISSVAATSTGNLSGNISAVTDAYSAYLNCRAVDSQSYTAIYNSSGIQDGFEEGEITIKFSDRSCSLSQSRPLSNVTQTYSQTWQQRCDGQAETRIGLLAGIYSSPSVNKLTNISVISCIPSYWRSRGLLTVSLDKTSTQTSNYLSFDEQNSTIMQPKFASIFEVVLPQYLFFNAAATTRSDALGFAILSAAKRSANNDAVAAMDTTRLLNVTERVFSTLYAGFATTFLLVPLPDAIPGSGILSQPVTRLFVTQSIAYVIVAVLLLIFISHLVLWIYSARHVSVLSEEPIGILGNAILLDRNEVDHILSQTDISGKSSDVRSTLKKRYNVEDARCYWDSYDNKVKVVGLTRK